MQTIRGIFYKFFSTIGNCFSGFNFLWHIVAIGLTYIIATSGFDWFYFQFTRGDFIQTFFFLSIRLGEIVPIVLPIVLYGVGKQRKNFKMLNVAFAIGQAVITSFVFFAIYKGVTGRAIPPLLNAVTDTSRIFHFGILGNSIFWGWPSGHTMLAFSLLTTLWILYSENKLIKYISTFYAIYIALGMSVTLHWFSDVVAGALIGVIIGITVGKNFKERLLTKFGVNNR